MFQILSNGQVMKFLKGDTFEQWIPYGSEYIVEEIKNENGEVISTIKKKFNLEKGEYEVI